MIKLPNDYKTARAYDGTVGPTLTPGGHICRISAAKLETARSGAEMLVVAFDIAEGGEFDGYFRDRHERATGYNPTGKWPGVFRTGIVTKDGKTNGYFKGLITAIEESNAGYSFEATGGNEATLAGKMGGFCFGEEEFRASDGSVKVSVKPFYAVSVARVREGLPVPARKPLNDQQAQMERQGFSTVDNDDELPF